VVEEQQPAPQVLAPAPAVTPRIGFRNPLAFRAALLAGAISSVCNVLAFIACPLWLFATGSLGVWFYRRRGGAVTSLRDGAKMGWISGLMSFLLFSVPYSFWYADLVSRPDFQKSVAEQFKNLGLSASLRDQAIESLHAPVGMQVASMLFTLFLVFTLFSLLGGLIGAKLLKSRS